MPERCAPSPIYVQVGPHPAVLSIPNAQFPRGGGHLALPHEIDAPNNRLGYLCASMGYAPFTGDVHSFIEKHLDELLIEDREHLDGRIRIGPTDA